MPVKWLALGLSHLSLITHLGCMDTRLCQLCLLLHFDCFWWQARAEHEPLFSCRPSHLSMKQLNMTCFCTDPFMESWFPATFQTDVTSAWHSLRGLHWSCMHLRTLQIQICAMQSITLGTGSRCASTGQLCDKQSLPGRLKAWSKSGSQGEDTHYKKQTAGHDSWFWWA